MIEKRISRHPNCKSRKRMQYICARTYLYDHYYRSLTLHVIRKNPQYPSLTIYLENKKRNVTFRMIRYRQHFTAATVFAL